MFLEKAFKMSVYSSKEPRDCMGTPWRGSPNANSEVLVVLRERCRERRGPGDRQTTLTERTGSWITPLSSLQQSPDKDLTLGHTGSKGQLQTLVF